MGRSMLARAPYFPLELQTLLATLQLDVLQKSQECLYRSTYGPTLYSKVTIEGSVSEHTLDRN